MAQVGNGNALPIDFIHRSSSSLTLVYRQSWRLVTLCYQVTPELQLPASSPPLVRFARVIRSRPQHQPSPPDARGHTMEIAIQNHVVHHLVSSSTVARQIIGAQVEPDEDAFPCTTSRRNRITSAWHHDSQDGVLRHAMLGAASPACLALVLF